MKILITDDERYELELLTELVGQRFGRSVQTRTAENGRQAVEQAALWGADIVLMDIEMPGLNGIEAAKRILEQRPDCRVIFVTAYSLFSYAYEAVKLGAIDYILKPVNTEDLERAIRRAIGQSETQRQLADAAPEAGLLEEEETNDKMTQLMEKVRVYLQQNYMTYGVSLESISDILNINSSYFSVLFKRYFGVNFVNYLTNLRMSAAKELLMDPMLATADVAGMVGYESPNYFTRAFKKNFGMTPTEFRKGGRKEMDP